MPFEKLIQLESLLPELPMCEESVRNALLQALRSRGSLSRARLAYSVACELELEDDAKIGIAAAIEFFHIASLLLDDLPCMDDANTRRGEACVHRVWGESAAILAALALINRAYFLFHQSFSFAEKTVSREANALANECLGLAGIVNGQALDLNFENTNRSPAVIRKIAQQKTGALFRLCLVLPAVLGGASRYEKMHLARLANIWGMAYQAADDLKDVLLGESLAGKTVRQDASLGRPNIALAIGAVEAAAELTMMMEEANASVAALSDGFPRRWLGISVFQKEFLAKVEPLLANEAVA